MSTHPLSLSFPLRMGGLGQDQPRSGFSATSGPDFWIVIIQLKIWGLCSGQIRLSLGFPLHPLRSWPNPMHAC